MLKYPAKWRVTPPPDGDLYTATVPAEAREEFFGLVRTVVANTPEQKQAFEEFKRAFALATGGAYGPSSSRDYAEYDLGRLMEEAASNAPKFFEAFHDGWLAVAQSWPELAEVDTELINLIAQRHAIGYIVEPPELCLRNSVHVVPVPATALFDTVHEQFTESIERSEHLLREGRGREAIQNSLWLLESISTAFQDVGAEGHYFNKIKDVTVVWRSDRLGVG